MRSCRVANRRPAKTRSMLFAILPVALVLASGCGQNEPFQHVSVSGAVMYEDGAAIPVDPLILTFVPQVTPVDAKTYPRPGSATADKNGNFLSATTHKPNDGLVCGKHKVVLMTARGEIPPTVVPPEYCNPSKTPLEVDTANQPFELKVRKPR